MFLIQSTAGGEREDGAPYSFFIDFKVDPLKNLVLKYIEKFFCIEIHTMNTKGHTCEIHADIDTARRRLKEIMIAAGVEVTPGILESIAAAEFER